MSKIGTQHGATAAANRWRDLDPGGTKLKKSGGKWPSIDTLTIPLDQWGAWDKLERALTITFTDHDSGASGGSDSNYLQPVQGRVFLAQSPLDSLQGPPWLVPVCTADLGYREWYTPEVIEQLRKYFGTVEAWCDCRASGGTPYSTAVAMVDELGLDGPAWGQCEKPDEFEHAYAGGARRMVGNLSALHDDQRARVASAEVLITSELYRNVMPWQTPDWMGCEAGVGGDCIACYASQTEGAVYTPVADYRARGYYTPGASSVYGVGLTVQDWRDLA